MEKVRTKTIAGRKVKEFEFTGEVKFRLRFVKAQDWNGTEVHYKLEVPETEGIKTFLDLCKKQRLSGGDNEITVIENGIVYYSERFVFSNLPPEEMESILH